MDRVHTGLEIRSFSQPDSVVSVSLCKDSHLPANENGCPDTYSEFFADGTQPHETCPLHDDLPTPDTGATTAPPPVYSELLEQLDTEEPFPSDDRVDKFSDEPDETAATSSSDKQESTETNSFDDLLQRLSRSGSLP